MSSGLRVSLATVLPFLALAALGLWLTQRTPAAQEGTPPPLPLPAPSLSRVAGAKPAQGSDMAPPGTSTAPAPPPKRRVPPFVLRQAPKERRGDTTVAAVRGQLSAEDVAHAVSALTPLLEECLRDHRGELRTQEALKVRFTLDAEAGPPKLSQLEVEGVRLQSPWLEACFQDSAHEVVLPAFSSQGLAVVTQTLRQASLR